jgi:hypothetical protein
MERVVSFVRASCERDALPEWLTEAVVERFALEFLQDPRYIPRRLAAPIIADVEADPSTRCRRSRDRRRDATQDIPGRWPCMRAKRSPTSTALFEHRCPCRR